MHKGLVCLVIVWGVWTAISLLIGIIWASESTISIEEKRSAARLIVAGVLGLPGMIVLLSILLVRTWRTAELPIPSLPRLRRGPPEQSAGQLSEADTKGGESA